MTMNWLNIILIVNCFYSSLNVCAVASVPTEPDTVAVTVSTNSSSSERDGVSRHVPSPPSTTLVGHAHTAFIGKALALAVDRLKPLLDSDKAADLSPDVVDEDYTSVDLGDHLIEDEPLPPSVIYSSKKKSINESFEILKIWSQLTGEGIEAALKELTPLAIRLSYENMVSSQCAASIVKLFSAVRKQELWAFRCKIV